VRSLLVLILVAACGGSDGGDGGGGPDAAAGDAAPGKEVSCGDNLVCRESGASVCCVGFDLSGGGLVTECRASISACGPLSRFACDDTNDCDGQPCCYVNISSGGGNTITAECKPSCSLLEGELCSGAGTCTGGRFCCIAAGDRQGECVASESVCGLGGD